jgi:hypothetical protein
MKRFRQFRVKSGNRRDGAFQFLRCAVTDYPVQCDLVAADSLLD